MSMSCLFFNGLRNGKVLLDYYGEVRQGQASAGREMAIYTAGRHRRIQYVPRREPSQEIRLWSLRLRLGGAAGAGTSVTRLHGCNTKAKRLHAYTVIHSDDFHAKAECNIQSTTEMEAFPQFI